MNEVDYQKLEQRLGRQYLEPRLRIQSHHVAKLFGQGKVRFHLEHIRSLHKMIRGILRVVGLYKQGHRNALNVRVRFNDLPCSDLPDAFNGFRLLHISDTHIDGNPGLKKKLIRLIEPLEYDVCVITGDFREGTFEDYEIPAKKMVDLCRSIKTEVYAVLGNHDAVEMVPILEKGGIQVLLNEHIELNFKGEKIVLVGVDDPHYYETDNLEKALENVPADRFKILLAHSPEICRKAAFSGIDLYLCGHTHGGQICLPGGRPILINTKCPHRFRSGLWTYEEMLGYTSVGAGTSSVNVRFNCPPEISIHRLVKRS
jgi:predicted MPP superfamily phosphohydrolase